MSGVDRPKEGSSALTFKEGLDVVSHAASLYAVAAGVTHKLAPHWIQRIGRPESFRNSGLFGIASMAWNSYRAVERIFSNKSQDPMQRKQDLLLLAGGLLTAANIGLGVLRRFWVFRVISQQLAFADPRLPFFNWIQNLLMVGNLGCDVTGIVLLADDWHEHPDWNRGLQLGFQLALFPIFGVDAQTLQAFRSFKRVDSPVEVIGRIVARKLTNCDVPNIELIRDNPHNLAALFLSELGLPPSHTFGVASHYHGNREDLPQVIAAAQAIRRSGLFSRLNFDAQPLDLLLAEVLHQMPTRHSSIRSQDLREAQGMIRSGMFQRFVVNELFPYAAQAKRRVGQEVEWGWGPSAPAPTRDAILEKMKQALEAQGWQVSLLPHPSIRLGKKVKVWPGIITKFEFDGHRYVIENFQGSGDNLLYVWRNGERLNIAATREGGNVSRPAREVLSALNENQEHAVRRIAEIVAKEKGGDHDLTESLLQEVRGAIQKQEGLKYSECSLKDVNSNYLIWSYDPKTKRILLQTMQRAGVQGEEADYLPETYETFDQAFIAFRRMLEEDRIQLVPSDHFTGLSATKGDRTLQAALTFDILESHELVIHNMIAGEQDAEFLKILSRSLTEMDVQTTYQGHRVSQQMHMEVDHPDLCVGPTVRLTQTTFRYLHLILPGMPPTGTRQPFIQTPRHLADHYPMGVTREELERQAIQELTGKALDRRTTDGTPESLVDWYLRVSGRIYEMTPVHYGLLNLDHILSRIAKLFAGRRVNTDIKRRLESRMRSNLSEPYQTAEIRLNDTPWEANPDGTVSISPDGIEWNYRFWAGFLHAAQTGLLDQLPSAEPYRRMAAQSLNHFLGV